jgi:hypothetical protein
MPTKMSRREWCLALGLMVLGAVAALGLHIGNLAGYHAFVDERSWRGVPHAGDVLSNLAFVVAGLAGAWSLWRLPRRSLANMQRAMAALFFGGLIVTAACSSWYHLQPDDARLVVDRSGMAIAFAGLLGLAAAAHVSERAGALVGLGLLLVAPWAIHAAASGELLPWAVLQFGGMAALCAVAWLRPLPNAVGMHWLAVVVIYALAKLAEAGDAWVFETTHQLVSGHSLKHLIAAMAAWPVVAALKDWRYVQNCERVPTWLAALAVHE